MNYYVEKEAGKAGYRPIEQDEWQKVVSEGFIYNDVTKTGSRRYRIVELNERWYCWVAEPHLSRGGLETWHTCWEIDPKIEISIEAFQRYRNFFTWIDQLISDK